MKFSLTTVLLFVASIGIACGWYADHKKLSRKLDAMSQADAFEQMCNSVTVRDFYARLDGVDKLREHGGESVLPSLIYALGDPDHRIAKSAREALESLTEKSFRDTSITDKNGRRIVYEWGKWIDWYRNRHGDRSDKGFLQFAMHVQSAERDRIVKAVESSDDRK